MAFAACPVPMLPLAPPMFSTKNCRPNRSESRWAISRAHTSVGPPGPNGTIMRTGLAGYVCAPAIRAAGSMSAPAHANVMNSRRGRVMQFPLELGRKPASRMLILSSKAVQIVLYSPMSQRAAGLPASRSVKGRVQSKKVKGGNAMQITRRNFISGGASAVAAAAAAPALAAPWEESMAYPDPRVQVLDPSFNRFRVQSASVERLWTGGRWSEGPVWMGDWRCLLWSDVANNRIMRWDEITGRVSVYR